MRATQNVWSIARLLPWVTAYLAEHGVEEPRLSGEVLLARAVGCRRIDLYTRFEEVPDEPCLAMLRNWIRRAAAKEPIAYLVEEKEFFSLPFRVTRDVLIPRPETELLVESVLDHCAARGLTGGRILDLGTGSGCIAVALLSQMPEARCTATDVSEPALQVARDNAMRHGVGDRFQAIVADKLDLPGSVLDNGGFDVLVCNPPYVPAESMDGLDRSVREYEPRTALTDELDGLSFYRAIAAGAPGVLSPDGAVFVEVGDGRMPSVVETVEGLGTLVLRKTVTDRVVAAERVAVFDLAHSGRETAP